MTFIEEIAAYVQIIAPKYQIKVCSPIIAQACLESAYGKSELATKAHNYFGIKYREGRCPSCIGKYHKVGSEQKEDGSYIASDMVWCQFPDMESGVEGYFEFINNARYANLKGITSPQKYLETIKADGYATSLNYVSNLLKVISENDLTRFDEVQEGKSMRIALHAGHAAVGCGAIGAVGLLNESIEDRIVKNKVKSLLSAQGHTVIDCTVDKGTQSGVLNQIVKLTNAANADLNVSIHFNSGASRPKKDGKTTGTEVYIYDAKTKCAGTAKNIVNAIAELGFKNRGVKVSKNLTFLKKTKGESLLVECCFVDDGDDAARYNADAMASAIVKGITGQGTVTKPAENTTAVSQKVGSFKIRTKVNLNVRKTPSAADDSNLTGQIAKRNNVFTITDVNGSWGKLVSGAGWINISTLYVIYC